MKPAKITQLPGGKRRVTYDTVVNAAGASPETVATFGAEVDRVLNDPRGWQKYGYEFVRQVARPAITIRLEDSGEANELCNATGFSCWRPDQNDIVIHLGNWMGGSQSSLPLERYRNYVISHETGHALGLEHQLCPAAECARRGLKSCPASIMQQATRGPDHIAPCTESDWPLDPDWRIDDPRTTPRQTRLSIVLIVAVIVVLLALVAGALIAAAAITGSRIGFLSSV